MPGDFRTPSRPYAEDGDLARLRGFLSGLATDGPPHSCWHPGDLVWTVFQFSVGQPVISKKELTAESQR
jgi:hypothetical protein